jgi:hypothetical protein
MSKKGDIKIRQRERVAIARDEGYVVWNEWQVWRGKVIIGRFDTKRQAMKFADEIRAQEAQE